MAEEFDAESWKPKTDMGMKVKTGEITSITQLLRLGKKVLEAEIVDVLMPGLKSDFLFIGQAKGKFGGGQRRIFRQTQKKTREGNKPKFATMVVVGDEDGHVGLGYGKAKETVPAKEKSLRNAKRNIFEIARGCGSWECLCGENHTVPFTVEGRCGSVRIKLIPAPKGKGLCVEKEVAKILKIAGISDVWSNTLGQTKNKINLIKACEKALKKLTTTRVLPEFGERVSFRTGSCRKSGEETEHEDKGHEDKGQESKAKEN